MDTLSSSKVQLYSTFGVVHAIFGGRWGPNIVTYVSICDSEYSDTEGFPGGSAVKNPPVMLEQQEMQFRSLGQEDPLEQDMATHSSILAWSIPRTEEPGGLQSMGRKKSDTTERLSMHVCT